MTKKSRDKRKFFLMTAIVEVVTATSQGSKSRTSGSTEGPVPFHVSSHLFGREQQVLAV